MSTPRCLLKVCCIQSAGEARLAVHRGASLLGLVGPMPSGPGPIPETDIAAIAAAVPPGVTSVLLTSEQSVEAVAAQHRRCRTAAIQLVDRLLEGSYRELREALPGVRLIQVIHVTGPSAVAEATEVARHVDAILLDSGDPAAAVKELGGTGRVHDWEISRRIVERIDRPVFLAGGIREENVAEAVRRVGPFGIDVCSGVRVGGALDEGRLGALARQLWQGAS